MEVDKTNAKSDNLQQLVTISLISKHKYIKDQELLLTG